MQALRRHPLLAFAVAFIVVQLLVAIFADWIAPYDPVAQDVIARRKGPSAAHWLGTDQFGRDILSRIIHGWRSSLAVSVSSVGAALLLGGTLGLVAAYYRGWTDRIVMRVMDVFYAFPSVLLAVAVGAMAGSGLLNTVATLTIVFIPPFVRVMENTLVHLLWQLRVFSH